MSTIIKFDLKELRKLANNKDSCVVEKKVTQNLALQPWCLGNLKESIKNLLDYKIGKFDKEYNGILLSYKNLRILQNVGAIRNDNSDIHFQVQADYFIFQPYVGATLRGIVNKKSVTHLGILVHRVFNVVIPRPTEEPGNKWIGSSIQEGQEVVFRIVVLDLFGALPYIRGELDEGSLQDDDEDSSIRTKTPEPLNVSYVNFDKTKPYTQRRIGDGVQRSSLSPQKNQRTDESTKSRNSISNTSNLANLKTTPSKMKNGHAGDGNQSSTEKVKIKRQSKVQDADLKSPKLKKNKKET